MSPLRRQRGALLIESLVAITLLSVALAGNAALLLQALQQSQDALLREIALRSTRSAAEALRGLPRTDGLPLQAVTAPDGPADCPLSPADCAAEQAALEALAQWRAELVRSMPAGTWCEVATLGDAPTSYLLRVEWPSRHLAQASSLQFAVEP